VYELGDVSVHPGMGMDWDNGDRTTWLKHPRAVILRAKSGGPRSS
jgi:hypothetical protein